MGPFGGIGVAGGVFAEAGAQHPGVDHAGIQRYGSEAGREFLGESGGEAFDAPLGGAVGATSGAVLRPQPEETFTTTPVRRCIMPGKRRGG